MSSVNRKRQLGRIHAGAKALGLDDATYRALLERVTGKRSSGDMTSEERNAVIAELVRLGFKAERHAARKSVHAGRPKGELSPQLGKVEALLADAKRPWSYAHGMARRMFKISRVQWCNSHQLQCLIAALEYDARRRAHE